ncbi:MAG: gamma-glutamyl-gamma-aminobutyrate hydrolase family protein [Tissierellales bacterium]|nr:gamma-glutamyl-gamma-aminobutyrate hydrolase family protein [Tissierellales bacterium]MBN2826918.1 gamma-glutamyl-gamma-aminobutyrate hydrolase family protein [Tissierellales bacterium]
MKPKIGILLSMAYEKDPKNYLINEKYVKSIADNGGIPIVFPTLEGYNFDEEYAGLIDGLLLPGGDDVHPMLYHEEPIAQVTYATRARDRFEVDMLMKMHLQNKPVMGICRGLHIINVAFGGSLIQDIPTQTQSAQCHVQSRAIRSEPFHKIILEPNTIMSSIFGKETAVNTFHHQAINRMGEGLVISAKAQDGIIEAIEHKDKKIFAVQWHPEEMFERFEEQAYLFQTFIKMAMKKEN